MRPETVEPRAEPEASDAPLVSIRDLRTYYPAFPVGYNYNLKRCITGGTDGACGLEQVIPHSWMLVALTVGLSLIGIVTFGSLAGSMLPFVLRRLGFDPASASAPFVATLVDVTGLSIYFLVALIVLHGTVL